MKKACVFYLLFISLGYAKLSDIQFELLSPADGLVDDSILDILQDSRGYLWLATAQGLSRYDGYSFTNYIHDPKDSTSIGGNTVDTIHEDKYGRLWFGVRFGGLNLYDPTTDSFRRFLHDPDDSTSLPHNWIAKIISNKDEDGLWIGTDDGLVHFDFQTEKFDHYRHDPNDSSSVISKWIPILFLDKFDNLWVGTGNWYIWGASKGGLCRFDAESRTFKRYYNQPENKYSLASNNVTEITEDQYGTLYIATESMLHRYDRELDRFERLEQGRGKIPYAPIAEGSVDLVPMVSGPLHDMNDYHWVSTLSGGVNRFDLKTGQVQHFTHNPDEIGSLSHNDISDLYEDRQGTIWVGTHASGLNKVIPSRNRFHPFKNAALVDILNKRYVTSILEDSFGNYWFGTREGDLLFFDTKKKSLINFRAHLNHAPNSAWIAFQDQSGHIWLGGENGVLLKFDYSTTRFVKYLPQDETNRYSNDSITSIAEFPTGTLWIGARWLGIDRFNPQSDELKQYRHDPSDDRSLSSNGVRTILIDSKENLWLGTDNGLNRYNSATDDFDRFCSGLSIRSLYEDSKGRLWIGTHGKGLGQFNHETAQITYYSTRDGLASNFNYTIIEDDLGFLWIGSPGALTRMDPESETFLSYDDRDGIRNQFANLPDAVTKTKSGELLFGGKKGVTGVYPDQFAINSFPPKAKITGLSIYDNLIHTGKLLDSLITLQFDQNDVTFDYVGLHFKNPARNKYKVKLEPYETDWKNAGTQRQARYTNLSPGDYTFLVKASNSDGIWNEEAAVIHIHITPPWWKTWFAYIIYALIILAILWTARRLELNRRKEKERKRLLEAEHKRKSEELERARQLQLSMLPKNVPELPNLDIAAYMNPATEVGGDYYDFHLASDGTLTVAVGDATGHGLNAGMMVTATKSLFESLGGTLDTVPFMNEANRTIKQMRLETLKMAFTILKIKEKRLYASGAGMPSLLVYRNSSKNLEEINFEGMPLGSLAAFPYEEKQTELSAGDKVILMSDGFPERQNPAGEMLGYPQAYETISTAASGSPQEVVEYLVQKNENWADGRPQDDDVTFVVIEVK